MLYKMASNFSMTSCIVYNPSGQSWQYLSSQQTANNSITEQQRDLFLLLCKLLPSDSHYNQTLCSYCLVIWTGKWFWRKGANCFVLRFEC